MRAQGDHRQRVWRTLSVLALCTGLLASTSCARRLRLNPEEFERVDKREQATEALRVYVSKRLVVLYEADDRNNTYEVDRSINTSQDRQVLRVITGRSTMGQIIDKEERNGAPMLWVTFSSRCNEKDCAYGFVQAEDGVFRLTKVPDRDGYQKPAVFYKNERKRMTSGKLMSLAEKNNVFLYKNWRDKIRTIDLIVKKRTDNKRKVDTIRDGGVR